MLAPVKAAKLYTSPDVIGQGDVCPFRAFAGLENGGTFVGCVLDGACFEGWACLVEVGEGDWMVAGVGVLAFVVEMTAARKGRRRIAPVCILRRNVVAEGLVILLECLDMRRASRGLLLLHASLLVHSSKHPIDKTESGCCSPSFSFLLLTTFVIN